MSVFFIYDREAQQARADAAQPSTRNQGFFDDPQGDGGAFEGIGQSFVSGLDTGAAGLTGWLANANRRIGYFAADENGVGWRTDGEDWFTGYLEDLNETHRANMQSSRVDPRTRSEAANMVGDLTRVLTAYTSAGAAGGPLALLTGTAGGGMGLGYDEYDRLIEMGADEETALGGARIAGTYGALGGAAPVSVPGRIVTRALTGAGLNVGLGAGQRGQTSAYLQEQGYPELALQYNWLDPQAAVVDGLFGGVFGAAFGQRAPESVRPHAGDDGAEGGEAPLLPPDADGFFEEARQYGTDEQFAEAYAYALIARDMGHPEADGLLAIIEEDASAADIDAGTAIANQIAQSQLGAAIDPAARDAARVQADTIQRATAFGIPVDAASRRWQSEAVSRAEMQAARDEEIDVGPVPEGVDFVPLDDIEMMASEIEYAARAVEETPQSLTEWVRRQGEVRDARGRVVQRGGIRDDRGEVAGGAGDGRRGFASLLSPTGRTLDDLALSAWESGFFPGLVDRPTINEFLDALDRDARDPGSVNADETASFEVRNSRDILRYYESRNIDISLRGNELRQALRPLAVEGLWNDALRAFEEEARAQGLDDVAGDVRRMREELGDDVGPLDDGALFSFGARRAPARGAESWRGESAFSDPRLSPSENKAVEMARNNYSNAEIADELDTSPATVSALLSKARAKIGGSIAARGTPSGRATEVTTERLVKLREELRRAGVPANKTKGSARTILSVMAERTGLSRDAVKQRLWKYDRQVEIGAREPLTSMGAMARDGRSTVDELQAVAVEEFGDAWESLVRAGLAEIVQSKADVVSERGLPRGVQAVHMRGADKSYFIANNISPENLRGLILHEIGVHHGMEEMLGERGKRALLRQVRAMVRAGQPDVARAMRFAKADNPGRPDVWDEEALAYLVEMQADLPVVQSMLSRVRQWLIKTFGTTFGMRLTVDDLRALTIASLRRLSERARREASDMTPINPVPLYSQGPDAGGGRGGPLPREGQVTAPLPNGNQLRVSFSEPRLGPGRGMTSINWDLQDIPTDPRRRAATGLAAIREVERLMESHARQYGVEAYSLSGLTKSHNDLYRALAHRAESRGYRVERPDDYSIILRRNGPAAPDVGNAGARQPVRVYHGTTRDFENFTTGNASNGATSDAGMALFFAENPETARIYSRSSAVDARSSASRFRQIANGVAPDQRQQLLDLASRKEAHESLVAQARARIDAIDTSTGGFNSAITPERRAAVKELERLLDNPPITNAEVRAAMRPRVVEAELNLTNPRRVNMRGQDWSEDLYASEIEAAKRAGNDGVIFEGVREPGAPADNVYAVFDPSVIRPNAPARGSEGASIQSEIRSDGAIEIARLTTPFDQRGQGQARQAMNDLIRRADSEGRDIWLRAEPLDKTTDAERLRDFYRSLGFEDAGDGGRMVRRANASGDFPLFSMGSQWARPIETAVEAGPEKASGPNWLTYLERAPDVTQETLSRLGLPEFLYGNNAAEVTAATTEMQVAQERLSALEAALETQERPRGFQAKEEIDVVPGGKGVSRRDFLRGAMGIAGSALMRAPLDLQFTPLPNIARNVVDGLQKLSRFELEHQFDNASHFLENALIDLRDAPERFRDKYAEGFDKTLTDYVDLARSLKLPQPINDLILSGRATHGIVDEYLTPETGAADWDVRRLIARGQEWLDGEELTAKELTRVEGVIAKGLGRALNAMEADTLRARLDDLDARIKYPEPKQFTRTEVAQYIADRVSAEASAPGGDDPLFSMGARGQSALDPVESPRFQAHLSDVEQRLIADGVLRERALGGEGAARGGGADQSGPNRAGRGESVPEGSRRGRGDNQGNAEPARIPRDIARDILSVSGLKLTRTTGVFGKYRASIDLPHDLNPEYAKGFADEGGEYPSALSFDLVEGATPRLFIRWSGLNPSLRNTGAGKWLYRQLIDWGLERGYEVYSDFSVSPSAQRIYSSLERMGYIIGRNPRATVKSDGTLSTNDLKPVFRVRGGDTAEILMSAPAPRGGYEIDGPTLKERMEPMREEAARQAEYDALPAAEQILRDQPEMLFSFGVARMRADELVAMVEAENNAAREMTKGVDAAAHCAIRHGVGQAVARSAGATFLTLNNQGAAGIMLGQVTGLALAVPVGVTAAPLIARDARRYSPQQRRLAELNYDIDQTQDAAQRAMERAREHAGALGLDEPTNYANGKPIALADAADPNGVDPAPAADGTPWQDYTPPGGRPLLSGDAPDAPADYTPPEGGKMTPEGSPVSFPPATGGPSDNPSPPANGSDLIDLFRPIVEGDE